MQKSILIMLMIFLAVVTTANANTVWNSAGNGIYSPDGADWDDVANWTAGIPGVDDQKPVFNNSDGAECQVTTETLPFSSNLGHGDGGPGGVIRVMDGGSITGGTDGSWCSIGWDNTAHMIVETGGLVTFTNHLWIGHNDGAAGTLDINGGTVRVDEMFGCNFDVKDASAQVNVNSGLLSLHNFDDIKSIAPGSNIDIKYGTVVFDGDKSGAIAAELADGRITGFGIIGNVKVEQINDQTILTAISNPMNPSPVMDAIVFYNTNLPMSWTNLDPNIPEDDVIVDVWFGTLEEGQTEPNRLGPLFTKVVDGGANVTSVPTVDASVIGETYYWQIDSYINGAANVNEDNRIESIMYKFSTTNDLPPTAEISTEDTLAWACEPGESGEVELVATVTDSGSSLLDITWVTANPNVTIANVVKTEIDPGIYVVTATVTADSEQRDVTLTITASDANVNNSDAIATVLVDFAADACQAARDRFMLYDYENPTVANIDGDCLITLADFAAFASEWLISSDEGRDSFELILPVAK